MDKNSISHYGGIIIVIILAAILIASIYPLVSMIFNNTNEIDIEKIYDDGYIHEDINSVVKENNTNEYANVKFVYMDIDGNEINTEDKYCCKIGKVPNIKLSDLSKFTSGYYKDDKKYMFIGWSDSKEGEVLNSLKKVEDINLDYVYFAKYEEATTITYSYMDKDNGGSVLLSATYLNLGDKTPIFPNEDIKREVNKTYGNDKGTYIFLGFEKSGNEYNAKYEKKENLNTYVVVDFFDNGFKRTYAYTTYKTSEENVYVDGSFIKIDGHLDIYKYDSLSDILFSKDLYFKNEDKIKNSFLDELSEKGNIGSVFYKCESVNENEELIGNDIIRIRIESDESILSVNGYKILEGKESIVKSGSYNSILIENNYKEPDDFENKYAKSVKEEYSYYIKFNIGSGGVLYGNYTNGYYPKGSEIKLVCLKENTGSSEWVPVYKDESGKSYLSYDRVVVLGPKEFTITFENRISYVCPHGKSHISFYMPNTNGTHNVIYHCENCNKTFVYEKENCTYEKEIINVNGTDVVINVCTKCKNSKEYGNLMFLNYAEFMPNGYEVVDNENGTHSIFYNCEKDGEKLEVLMEEHVDNVGDGKCDICKSKIEKYVDFKNHVLKKGKYIVFSGQDENDNFVHSIYNYYCSVCHEYFDLERTEKCEYIDGKCECNICHGELPHMVISKNKVEKIEIPNSHGEKLFGVMCENCKNHLCYSIAGLNSYPKDVIIVGDKPIVVLRNEEELNLWLKMKKTSKNLYYYLWEE